MKTFRQPNKYLPLLPMLLLLLLAGSISIYIVTFITHAWNILTAPYPLDYGEGPLLAQLQLLQQGMPIWEIYSDPSASPYIIVNYPPLSLLLTHALSHITGNILLAGRILSLLATLGSVLAIGWLASPPKPATPSVNTQFLPRTSSFLAWLLALLLLTIPIIREWGVLLRVDMLGLCLGLYGLLALRKNHPILAGTLLALSLSTKPSLLAAPLAGILCLLQTVRTARSTFPKRMTEDDRPQTGDMNQATAVAIDASGKSNAIQSHPPLPPNLSTRTTTSAEKRAPLQSLGLLILTMGIIGATIFMLLQTATNGWFSFHIITANANRWDPSLAHHFWLQQTTLRWPLMLAAALSIAWSIQALSPATQRLSPMRTLPYLYTLIALVLAIGVGKVGAYANYFLEMYAGLIWIITSVFSQQHLALPPFPPERRTGDEAPEAEDRHRTDAVAIDTSASGNVSQKHPPLWALVEGKRAIVRRLLSPSLLLLLLIGSLLPYELLWSPTTLHKAGILEPNPPCFITAMWHDLKRETEILAARQRVYDTLIPTIQQTTPPIIFTDRPGIAAAASVQSRLQPFEHRQLYDQGHAHPHQLLQELANGALPLVVVEYLGNWLTPAMTNVITHRYAQDGSLGTFDLYRPVNPGPFIHTDLPITPDLHLNGYHMQTTARMPQHIVEAGDTLLLTLEWQRSTTQPTAPQPTLPPTVTLQLTDANGHIYARSHRPLFYGAFSLQELPLDSNVQHMQPLALPTDLPAASYTLHLSLHSNNQPLAPATSLATITVTLPTGHFFPQSSYYVPAPFLQTWQANGGLSSAGLPLTPAVPFDWGQLQCFERTCLEQRNGIITQRPLGQLLYLAETKRSTTCIKSSSPLAQQPAGREPSPPLHPCPSFARLWKKHGGAEILGPPISGELERNELLVQWTRNARLERSPDGSYQGLGRLGDDVQRLPPGVRYRWP